MWDINYGENGAAQGAGNQGSKFKSQLQRLGTFSGVGTESGTYQVGTCGKDSHESDISIVGGASSEGIGGKLLSQLIAEASKQLAYHEQQATLLRARVEELKQVSESINSK